MKRWIKEPIKELLECWEYLNQAVDAHLSGDKKKAEDFFKLADMSEIWDWLNLAWTRPDLNVVTRNPPGDTQTVPKKMRDPDRGIAISIRREVLKRDGYCCRYCGLPVVDASIRKLAHQLYPDAVPWDTRDPKNQHAGFQCLWLQFDHVEPHSHGGSSSKENVVVSCALCNFGKDKYTLRQLNLENPFLRPPIATDWDGLERFKNKSIPLPVSQNQDRETPSDQKKNSRSSSLQAFFLPGSWLKGEYLYTPPIGGKKRWFKLGPNLSAEPVVRAEISGYRVVCYRKELTQRGINAELFVDHV